ncbi:MAG: hypothetical protein ACRDJN_19635, partial [Chloroflexota bacterium]
MARANQVRRQGTSDVQRAALDNGALAGNAGNAARLMIDFQQMATFVEDPLVLDRGEGCWVWDVQGRKYFDG